jgi:carbamoyl-phosphate synthase large subunit
VEVSHWAVKEAVFPFDRFGNVDTLLGPEMKSTGEVMGLDDHLGLAFAKSQLAAGQKIPTGGNVLISVRHPDKPAVLPVARRIADLGFTIIATAGTAQYLTDHGVACVKINKISQGRPHILDKIHDKEICWIINTSMGSRTTEDSYAIRRSALDYHLPYSTTVTGALSMVKAMEALRESELNVKAVQEYFEAR